MGVWNDAGLRLVAAAVQSPGVICNISYVSISKGCGASSAAITSGVAITSLSLDAPLPANVGSGVSLTIYDGTNAETVTTNGAALAGATSITITSWTPTHSYAAHVTGIAPTPLAGDVALYNEGIRISANPGSAGATAGESLNSAYFDGTQDSGLYLLAGFFGGSTATSSLGTGTLMGEGIMFWNHTINNDSTMVQSDNLL